VPFNSLEFLIFFLLVVAGHSICPPRYRWVWLLATSLYFYATWAPGYGILLVLATFIVYILAFLTAPGPDPAAAAMQVRRKAFLILGIVLNLGMLAAYKYLVFLNEALRGTFARLGLAYNLPAYQILLPIGISFYTFQSLGYLIDVYRGQIEPERHFGLLVLFNAFFPQLVSGPIERANHLLPQFREAHPLRASNLSTGLRWMLWGLFKKVVVADRLGVYVDAVYNNPADVRGWPVVLATLFFAVQLYSDFSGYMDIARGAAKTMGYDLLPNFRQPYAASSIAGFWRRWHISLTSWFRDYLYIPLGGNRVPRRRWYANVMIVFLLSGLWHGADWTFVLWGGLHGLYYLVEVWTQSARDRAARKLHLDRPALRTVAGTVVTLGLVCFAWLFFRANSVSDAFLLLGNMGQLGASTSVLEPWADAFARPDLEMAFSLGLIVLLAALHLLREVDHGLLYAIGRRPWVRWAAYLILALAILNLGIARQTPFVYLQF
jgi:D-alanyl-lipoteichoic acid acyltransferase DltB (MBOAT superfamily)